MVQRRRRHELSTLSELKHLAESAGHTIVGSLEQVRKRNPRYQIGSGKVKELAELVKEERIERTIFDNDLTPVQAYNLAKITGVEAIDRFQIILEIFARRASTYEAKLQIQLAKLRYELSRAKERVRLARMEEQPGFQGLGKYEVDIYYETVRRRIRTIRNRLKKKQEKRQLHRTRRADLGYSSISLAGYTNAGKSTLFNMLTEEQVSVDSRLFTTLSTTTRTIRPLNRKILITDTVGFIDRLPLTLIQAFRSTLEETIFSDLILLVVDMSEPDEEVKRKIACCLDVIQKIGANGIPIVTAFNKIDLLGNRAMQRKKREFLEVAPTPLLISALHGTNLGSLKEEIVSHLGEYVQATFSLPLTHQTRSFLSWLKNRVNLLKIDFNEDRMKIVFESVPWFAEQVKERVETYGGAFAVSN